MVSMQANMEPRISSEPVPVQDDTDASIKVVDGSASKPGKRAPRRLQNTSIRKPRSISDISAADTALPDSESEVVSPDTDDVSSAKSDVSSAEIESSFGPNLAVNTTAAATEAARLMSQAQKVTEVAQLMRQAAQLNVQAREAEAALQFARQAAKLYGQAREAEEAAKRARQAARLKEQAREAEEAAQRARLWAQVREAEEAARLVRQAAHLKAQSEDAAKAAEVLRAQMPVRGDCRLNGHGGNLSSTCTAAPCSDTSQNAMQTWVPCGYVVVLAAA